jgi:hypothetical protein
MGSQFDELAKAVARGTSRRHVFRSILGGLVGAVAAAVLPSGRTEAIEIAAPAAAEPSVRQVPRLNQAPIPLNRAPVKINQAPIRLNQASPLIPHNGPRAHPVAGGPGFNGPRPHGPGWNQRGHRFNQTHPRMNQQRLPWMNQHGARMNQGRPNFNQRGWPSFNHTVWRGFNQRGSH